MTRDRFEEILKKLSFTKANQPTYKDRIFEHREIESEWNRNMKEQYAPSDRSTLDESMKKWVNQFTCPGFMVVPASHGLSVMSISPSVIVIRM